MRLHSARSSGSLSVIVGGIAIALLAWTVAPTHGAWRGPWPVQQVSDPGSLPPRPAVPQSQTEPATESPDSARRPAPPSNEAAKHLASCLEQLQTGFDYDAELDVFTTVWQLKRWRDSDGEDAGRIDIYPDSDGDVVVSFANAYDLSLCTHINACRRVMTEAYWKAGARASFLFDPRDGEVRAAMRIPGGAGRVDAKVLEKSIQETLSSVDLVDFAMRKAMARGDVDWPADDLGPQAPSLRARLQADGVEPFELAVAPWVEPDMNWARSSSSTTTRRRRPRAGSCSVRTGTP